MTAEGAETPYDSRGVTPVDPADSIAHSVGDDPTAVLRTVAERYVGDAPRRPFTYRATPEAGLLMDGDGRVRIDFAERFPDSEGEIAYAWGVVPETCDGIPPVDVEPAGPVRVFVDGELVVEGDTRHQAGRDGPLTVDLPLTDGQNHVVVECERTPAGFGCTIDPQISWRPLRVLAPTPEREGQAGWLYTSPRNDPLESRPGPETSERESDAEWFPRQSDRDAAGFDPVVEGSDGRGVAWTTVAADSAGEYAIAVDHDERLEVFVDGEKLYDRPDGSETVDVEAGLGTVDLVVGYEPTDTACDVAVHVDGEPASLEQPHPVAGTDGAWFHAGPVDDVEPSALSRFGLDDVATSDTAAAGQGPTYWRTAPETWVRPHVEREPFGTWSYPVGVTLYGILETGRALGRSDLVSYVRDHLRECTTAFQSLEWDRERFGLPAVDEELAACSMLDHCGSMGATLLEATTESDTATASRTGENSASDDLPGTDAVVDFVAEYMAEDQERLPDGTFYRTPEDIRNMNETLWADDLYMSTPFLARYAERTGDRSTLDDAIHQFERFEHYLGMEDPTILSHVYDGRHETATGVPWGRGNGWALFSMAETLDRTPEDHPDREALLDRFQRFAAGYHSVQGEDGFWHQVLTDPSAYRETSCTAMFTWAFARGVRRGWLPADPYADAALAGWDAITTGAIDADGNVHGVCHGSSYSFSPDYYTDDLGTVTNDRHGIGIVLLAGVETHRLRTAD